MYNCARSNVHGRVHGARALMYMDVRYAGGSHGITGAAEPDLIQTDDLQLIDGSNTGRNEATGYMGMRSVLLDWHRQDPVDPVELQHHPGHHDRERPEHEQPLHDPRDRTMPERTPRHAPITVPHAPAFPVLCGPRCWLALPWVG